MSVHEEWLKKFEMIREQMKSKGFDVQFPPKSMLELKIEFLEVSPGVRIIGKAPFQERFTNPIKSYQGGMLSALLDDHFGPLSYITAQAPCSTLSLSTTFVKPFLSNTEHVIIEANVVKMTRSVLFMNGVIKTEDGEVIATAESHVLILRKE